MTIPKWQDRSIVVSNLLNPAFCGEILRLSIKAYNKESEKGFPFALSFLILPILLNKETRDNLPKTATKKFYEWLEDNVQVKINLANQIKNLTPYTRESLLFLIYHEKLKINDIGKLEFTGSKQKKIDYSIDEIKEIFKKANMIGKWFAKTGDIKTIYALVGIKP